MYFTTSFIDVMHILTSPYGREKERKVIDKFPFLMLDNDAKTEIKQSKQIALISQRKQQRKSIHVVLRKNLTEQI